MNTKHTPGPWAIDAGLDGAVIYDESGTIANVPIDLLAYSFNARLITAAPELLEALEQFIDAHQAKYVSAMAEDSERNAYDEAMDAARAAIAKATGGAR